MGLNFRAIIKILGILTLIEGLFMLPAVAAGLYYEEWKAAGSLFTISLICISVLDILLSAGGSSAVLIRSEFFVHELSFRVGGRIFHYRMQRPGRELCAFMHADVARIMPLAGRNGNSRASDFYLPSMGNK